MNLFRKLLAIEWIKMRRRSVFWVVILVHVMMLAVGLGVQQYMHSVRPQAKPFQLPGGWSTLIDGGTSTGMLMLLIGVALLTTSEATWRTQRQNVIDGLSRGQYFAGKILVALMLALILWVIMPVMGLIIAPFGGEGALTWPLFDSPAPLRLLNALLYFCAIAVTGFMFGMLASSSGAALGLMLAFIMIQPILGAYMAAQGGALQRMSTWLPMDVFGNLVRSVHYDPARLAHMREVMVKAGGPAPLSLSASVLMTLLYIAAFIGLTWLVFRERDL